MRFASKLRPVSKRCNQIGPKIYRYRQIQPVATIGPGLLLRLIPKKKKYFECIVEKLSGNLFAQTLTGTSFLPAVVLYLE